MYTVMTVQNFWIQQTAKHVLAVYQKSPYGLHDKFMKFIFFRSFFSETLDFGRILKIVMGL